jgi:hypothetical protein
VETQRMFVGVPHVALELRLLVDFSRPMVAGEEDCVGGLLK